MLKDMVLVIIRQKVLKHADTNILNMDVVETLNIAIRRVSGEPTSFGNLSAIFYFFC